MHRIHAKTIGTHFDGYSLYKPAGNMKFASREKT